MDATTCLLPSGLSGALQRTARLVQIEHRSLGDADGRDHSADHSVAVYREVVMVRRSQLSEGSRALQEGSERAPHFAELSVVALKNPVDVKGRCLPAGTRGTVVAAYRDGIGYEVEFFEPFHAVATLEANDLSA
jgi:hypothetical protein